MYDLNEFTQPNFPNAFDPNWFKSYDDLKKRLTEVLGASLQVVVLALGGSVLAGE